MIGDTERYFLLKITGSFNGTQALTVKVRTDAASRP